MQHPFTHLPTYSFVLSMQCAWQLCDQALREGKLQGSMRFRSAASENISKGNSEMWSNYSEEAHQWTL